MKFNVGMIVLALVFIPSLVLGSYDSNQVIVISQLQIRHQSGGLCLTDPTSGQEVCKPIGLEEQLYGSYQGQQDYHITKGKLALVAEEEVMPPSPTREDYPMADRNVSLLPEESDSLGSDDSLFGWGGGRVHPYVALYMDYTDNLFNLDEDRTSNSLTMLTAGIWLTLPGKDEEPVAMATHNPSGGGLQLMLDDYEGTDRYELYLKGGVDYSMYSSDSDLDDYAFLLEGMGRYNSSSGLSLQLTDQYTNSRDRFDVGFPDSYRLHVFQSNVVIGTVDWLFTDKFRAKGDISYFLLRYDDEEFDYLERDDLFFDLYGFYNYSEKTSFFLNYKYGILTFDSYNLYDNQQNFLYAGMKWYSTEKLTFMAKMGYQTKEFTDAESTYTDYSGLALETQVEYRLAEKTRLQFSLYKKDEETDTLMAQDRDVWGATFNYDHDYTDKLKGIFRLRYEYVDYTELVEQKRDEWKITLEPKVQYAFTDWFNAELGYQYEKRDSTDDDYDYYSNAVFLNLILEL